MARTHLRPGIPAVLGAAAFLVFLVGITGPSLWIDEAYSWRYATEPLGTMLSTAIGTTNAVEAAYYALLHFWIGIAGTSEVALRLPSAAAMAVAVWAASKTAGDAAGSRAATIAGLAMIVLPGVTRYAQEARPYSFAVAGISVSTYMLWRGLTRDERRWWAGYAAALVFVGYLHLVSLLVVAGQLVAVLLLEPRRWRRFVLAAASAALLVLPVAALGFTQRGQISWIPSGQLDYLWNGLSVLTGSIAVTACLALLVVACRGDRRLMAIGLPTALAPPILLWILGSFVPLYLARYLMAAAPGVALLVAAVLTAMSVPRALLALAILVALVLPAQVAIREPSGHGQDFRGAAALVATDCSAQISYDRGSRNGMDYYRAGQPCFPSETRPSDHLWTVQAEGPQVAEPGYTFVSASRFGTATVTYWARN